jgi:hypothetical protein
MPGIRISWLLSSLLATHLAGAADVPESASSRPGRVFFEQHVVPKLAENGCQMCHAVGYVHPNVLVYDEFLPYLAMGDAPEKTPVIRKIANLHAIRPDLPTHPGGQRCETIGSEPCKSIVTWWGIEFGADTGGDKKP